ncbi:hypothetical protein AAFF27_19220 [Xylophilus sp. GW821-FHT01B05]
MPPRVAPYAQDFFDLQLHFARRVAVLSGLPLASVLLDYTNLYVRFGLGRGFDAAHPVWREYLDGLERSADHEGWTYAFYLARGPEVGPPDVVATVGCFSYARAGEGRIRLHFHNAEADGHAPLSAQRLALRRAELHTLFAAVMQLETEPPQVLGTSWLYHLAAYRGLFPGAYIASATPAGPRFRNMPLWGQFLDRQGQLRQAPVVAFRHALALQAGMPGLGECFPLQPLALEAPASVFFDCYAA